MTKAMSVAKSAKISGFSKAIMHFEILHQFPDHNFEPAWRDFLTKLECPSHYNSPEFFAEPYWSESKPFAVLALADDVICGVLTGIHQGNTVVCGLASRPQICVAADRNISEVVEVLCRGLLEEAANATVITVYSWNSMPLPPFVDHGFRCRRLQGTVVLDLTKGADEVFKQFTKDRRRNIRYAEKHGVTIRQIKTHEDIVASYQVYKSWRGTSRKEIKGPGRQFEVWEKAAQLTNNRMMLVAEVEGKPVAVNIFRFFRGGLFESAANSSLQEYLPLKPNDLLQWRGIQWACSQGLRRHSLGGAHQFLTRFGGTVEPILRYRLDRTFLRRHEMQEAVREFSRDTLCRLSPALADKIRKMGGHHH